jgi:hypothetical protein
MIVAAGPVRWGTLPDAAAAVGTVGTLALTYVLLRRAAQQREQVQAQSVAVWVDLAEVPHNPVVESVRVAWVGMRLPTLFVRNASTGAVYATEAEVRCGGLVTATIDIGVAAPGATVEKILGDDDLGRADEPETYGFDPEVFRALKVTAGVRFTDSAGRRWERDPTGHLRPAEPDRLRRLLHRGIRPN